MGGEENRDYDDYAVNPFKFCRCVSAAMRGGERSSSQRRVRYLTLSPSAAFR